MPFLFAALQASAQPLLIQPSQDYGGDLIYVRIRHWIVRIPVHADVREIARTGTDAQRAAAAAVLADARRSLYLLLADGPEAPGT